MLPFYVSSGGPNVNLSFLGILHEQRRDNNLEQFLEVETCGLHTVHNGFKYGGKASGWSIDKVLGAMYKIFDRSPSRRGNYESLMRGIYPPQFCSHRWAENQIVAETAIDVWDSIIIVVNYWVGLPKAQQPKEGNESYSQLKTAIPDPLMKTKFKFIAATVKILNSFLVKFQTNNPMVPFLAQAIEEMMRLFGSCFLLKETLSKANTCLRLSKLNFNDPSLHKRPGDVDPGIGVKLEHSILKKNGKINENQVLNFNRDVVSFVLKTCYHPAEKSPIKVSLPRNSRCFIPSLLVENPEFSKARFLRVRENFVTAQQITDGFAEQAKQQFPKFLEIAKENKQSFAEFDPSKEGHCLGTFYWKHIEGVSSVEKVAKVF